VIVKKWLPKVTEIPPAVEEPVQRMVVLVAVLYHITYGEFNQIIMMIAFEYLVSLGRYFLCALTEDAAKWYEALWKGADRQIAQFRGAGGRPDNALIVQVPTEMFAVGFATLCLKGPLENRIAIGVGLVLFALGGGPIIGLFSVQAEAGSQKPKSE
jgi:hypothetical protein